MTLFECFHIAFETWTAIICLVGAIIIYFNRSLEPKASWSMIGVLLTDFLINTSETFGVIFDGKTGAVAEVITRVSHFLVFICVCLLAILVALHFGRMIEVRGGSAQTEIGICTAIALVNGVGVIASRVFGFYYTFDESNHYVRLDTYPVYIFLCVLVAFLIIIMVLKNRKVLRKREFIAFLFFGILVGGGAILQLFFSVISPYNLANSVAILIVILVHEVEFSADTVNRERQLSLARIHAYESQIQPHFIYNSLTAIRSQLPPDSEAVETLNHFTAFLRGTIDVMNEDECIAAERELQTVEHYLFLEKTRFGDGLTVKKDIRDEDFRLPAFTMQLLVENAVRHGIREKRNGRGTVTITTYRAEEAHVIEIADDGVGFDVSILDFGQSSGWVSNPAENRKAVPDMERGEHQPVGLINLKNRLELMCGGTLTIESRPGEGTRAEVRIPI